MRETVSGSFSLSQFQPAVKGQHSFTLMFIPSFPFCHLMLMRFTFAHGVVLLPVFMII